VERRERITRRKHSEKTKRNDGLTMMYVKMVSVKKMKQYFDNHWHKTESGGYEIYGDNGVTLSYLYDQLYPIADTEQKVMKLENFNTLFRFITEDGIPIPSDDLFVDIGENGSGI
jgi:hypothetical protein